MERGTRIELVTSAWKAEVIPFYEPRIIKELCPSNYVTKVKPCYLVPLDRIELPIDDYKSTVIPFN